MCYLVIGSSTETTLFHASCRPSHQVGVHPALISDLLVRKARPTLTSDHVVTYNHIRKALHSHLTWKELNPLTMTEWPTLTFDMEGIESSHHDRMARTYIWHGRNWILSPWHNGPHLHLTWKELNPLTMTEWPTLTYDLEGTKSSTLIRKAPNPRLSYLVTNQVSPLSRGGSCPYICPTW